MYENTFERDGIEACAMEATTAIITAGLHANRVNMDDAATLIGAVYDACLGCLQGKAAEPVVAVPEVEKPTAAQVRASIKPDGITSFEDGKAYKTMKRHLTKRGLTPETYRTKWGLPADYPMVAPAYGEARSALAKSIGLGRKAPTEAETAPTA